MQCTASLKLRDGTDQIQLNKQVIHIIISKYSKLKQYLSKRGANAILLGYKYRHTFQHMPALPLLIMLLFCQFLGETGNCVLRHTAKITCDPPPRNES